ncbi:flagellar basal body-associated FliL family protein [Ectopseudomonas mendocina]|uniref:Flagellar protein FliL n=1 Tax=Ectopseudomonas mendocina TaxID=300 RepID=A0ABZ2RES2_ECTME
MKALMMLLLALSLPALAAAQEDDKSVPKVSYVTMVPAFVGNFGNGPRMKFYKADISLRVPNAEVEAKVKHHEPLIRNQLVMLFSQQTDEAMSAPGAREALRMEALKQVQSVLTEEEGLPLVEDLLFNNLIVQ